jgi:putative nucleotidyltransferase with HDIG domain
MSVLYEGVKNSRLSLAARHSRRTRLLFAGLALLVFGGLCLAAPMDLHRTGLGIAIAWLLFALALGPWSKEADRRGRLGRLMVYSYAADLSVVCAFAWILGANPWTNALGIGTILGVAALYLHQRGVKAIFVLSIALLALLLASPHVAWLAPPSRALFGTHETGLVAWVLSFTALGVVFLSGFASLRFSAVSSQHESELRQANQRLRGLYEALSDQQFSLLVSQQDLLLANERLKQKSEEVLKSQDVIRTLAQALEARDVYTQGHSSRVAEAAVMLAREMGLSREEQDVVRLGCLLHDLGKINIPDAVLLKPGSLTDEEYGLMQRHPVVGEQICRPLVFARSCLTVIRHHHERWDGHGYPDKLKGDEISLFARIASIADSWDAMTTDRPYRKALAAPVAFSILEDGAGTQWDPGLVPVFIRVMSHHVDQRAEAKLEEEGR